MKLQPIAKRFVLHWGEMGSTWGVNRTIGQIHALLFIVGKPISAEEIMDTLGVARSNVSTSLRELQNWNLIRTVNELGDRRDYFESITDVWELFRVVVSGRKRREFDPTVEMLKDCMDSPDFVLEHPDAQNRIKETHELMHTLSVWADEMLRLEPETLMKILKMGAKIQNAVRRKSSSKTASG